MPVIERGEAGRIDPFGRGVVRFGRELDLQVEALDRAQRVGEHRPRPGSRKRRPICRPIYRHQP
jgi:hypothetical protein